MILGHRHPAVTRAVVSAVSELGTCFGLPYEREIEAARKVIEAVPGVELIRNWPARPACPGRSHPVPVSRLSWPPRSSC